MTSLHFNEACSLLDALPDKDSKAATFAKANLSKNLYIALVCIDSSFSNEVA